MGVAYVYNVAGEVREQFVLEPSQSKGGQSRTASKN